MTTDYGPEVDHCQSPPDGGCGRARRRVETSNIQAQRAGGLGSQVRNRARQYSTVGASLHIHPNTVDYRLGRIKALTGLNVSDPMIANSLSLR